MVVIGGGGGGSDDGTCVSGVAFEKVSISYKMWKLQFFVVITLQAKQVGR